MGEKKIIRYELETLGDEQVNGAIELINKQMREAALEKATEDVKRHERIVLLAMAKKYLTLRSVADKLYDTVKGSNYLDNNVKDALDKYADERKLSVEIEVEDVGTIFVHGENAVK